MLKWFIKTIKSLVLPSIILGVGLYYFKHYQAEEQARTFTVSLDNVDGLSRGTPVYAHGTRVGKVTKTTPALNDNRVILSIRISREGFPVPGKGTEVQIIKNIESGGGKIIELSNIKLGEQSNFRVQGPMLHDYASRLSLDAFQMTKDFANNCIRFLRSPSTAEQLAVMQNQLTHLKEQIEEGTLAGDTKKDLELRVQELNARVNRAEHGEDPLDSEERKALENQLSAIRNTVHTFASVSDLYKED